jgi:hypothetical protein
MPQKSFEEQLKDKAQEFSPMPREGMWGGIEAHLQPERKKRRGAFLLSASTAFILISCGLIYTYMHRSNRQQDTVAEVISGQDQVANQSGTSSDELPAPLRTPPVVIEPEISSRENITSGTSSPAGKIVLKNNRVTANDHDPVTARLEENNLQSVPTISRSDMEEAKDNKQVPKEILDNNDRSHQDIDLVKEDTDVKKEQNVFQKGIEKDSVPFMEGLLANKDTVKKIKPDFVAVKQSIASRKYIELVGMPVLSGTWLNIDKAYRDSMIYKSHVEDRKFNDKKTWNFGVGLQCGIEKGRYHVFAGLYYQSFAYKMSVRNINSVILRGAVTNFDFDFNATDSFAVSGKTASLSPNNPNPPERGENYVTNKFEYLSIPLGMTYMLKHTGKLRVGLSASIAPQFLLSYKGLLYQQESGFYVKQKTASENHISKMNLSAAAGVEMSYMIGGSSSVLLRPQFGISMFPAENARINTRLSFWSFALGYRKYF